jgi:transcription elongation GreA/GreB family factor
VLKINDGAPIEYQLAGFVGVQKHTAVVSTESPIGKAILGKHIGDIIEPKIAGKKVKIEIVSVA